MGLIDINNDNTFVWTDGSSSTYRFWSSGQPDNSGGAEDCVGTWIDEHWNDYPCSYILYCYFCSTTG